MMPCKGNGLLALLEPRIMLSTRFLSLSIIGSIKRRGKGEMWRMVFLADSVMFVDTSKSRGEWALGFQKFQKSIDLPIFEKPTPTSHFQASPSDSSYHPRSPAAVAPQTRANSPSIRAPVFESLTTIALPTSPGSPTDSTCI